MIRQARNYLRGAVSGTALIAVAIVVFALLVSLQTLRDWPFAGLIGGSEVEFDSATKVGSQVSPDSGATPDGALVVGSGDLGGDRGGNGGGGVPASSPAGNGGGGTPGPDAPVSTQIVGDDEGGGDHDRSVATVGVGGPGRSPSGGEGGSSPTGGVGGETASETVTGAVNGAVDSIDQVTVGALGGTGATKTTEEAVDDVAGPDSPAGETVDEVTEKAKGAVDDVLGGDQ